MARHAASSRLVRAPDELQAEDAHYWDRLLGSPAAAAALAAKTGRIAAGAAASLAQGTWEVGNAKVGPRLSATSDRVGKTIGGQIAAAIRSQHHAGTPDNGASGREDGSISTGDNASANAADEVAAFRNRKPE